MTTDCNMTYIYIYISVHVHIHGNSTPSVYTNYAYNLNPYQIYSYAMSCRYNSMPAFLSQIQLTTEASLCHLLFKTLQQFCDVQYSSKKPTLYMTCAK